MKATAGRVIERAAPLDEIHGGAGYGQPEKSAEALARVYADNGGNFA